MEQISIFDFIPDGDKYKPIKSTKMRILVACEESQAVCKAFREKGHEAYSCDIIECSGGHPEWHIMQDVLPLLNGNCQFVTTDGITHQINKKWDMIIAFPPCTYLTNTGNPYLNIKKWGEKAVQRYKKREEAFDFFMKFANADCERIIIENPIGYVNTHWRKPNQIIQPWQFGHPYTKSTCLWLKGVQNLTPVVSEKPKERLKSYAWDNLYDENGKTLAWNSSEIKKIRSKTFPGVANAMAEQWGQI